MSYQEALKSKLPGNVLACWVHAQWAVPGEGGAGVGKTLVLTVVHAPSPQQTGLTLGLGQTDPSPVLEIGGRRLRFLTAPLVLACARHFLFLVSFCS